MTNPFRWVRDRFRRWDNQPPRHKAERRVEINPETGNKTVVESVEYPMRLSTRVLMRLNSNRWTIRIIVGAWAAFWTYCFLTGMGVPQN